MVSEKKGKRRKKQKHRRATIWRGPGKGWDESLFSTFSLSMSMRRGNGCSQIYAGDRKDVTVHDRDGPKVGRGEVLKLL